MYKAESAIDLLLLRVPVCCMDNVLNLFRGEELQRGTHRMIFGTVFWKRPGGSVDRLIRQRILNEKDIRETAAAYLEDSLVKIGELLDGADTQATLDFAVASSASTLRAPFVRKGKPVRAKAGW